MRLFKTITSICVGLALYSHGAGAADHITVTDLAGRQVTLAAPVQHMILGESRYIPSLAILDRDNPIRRIVGMMSDFKTLDPAGYAQYQKRFPSIDDIPQIGASSVSTFSIEQAFSVKPDVAVFGLGSGHGPNDRHKSILDQFAAAGIPIVFIDFRIDPLVNTPKSIRLLGQIMGREAAAEDFLAFYQRQLDLVAKRLETVDSKPSVFMESRVGLTPNCCEAIGQAMMGRFIEWAGGRNAFGELLPGTHGAVNVEHLLTSQPDIYIGTAIGSALTVKTRPKAIALGANTDVATAQTSLQNTLKRTGLAQLHAVKTGRAYAIWHHFYNNPMNVVAVQVIAKWLHPEVFADLDPHATLATYFERFQPFPVDGVYWVGLP